MNFFQHNPKADARTKKFLVVAVILFGLSVCSQRGKDVSQPLETQVAKELPAEAPIVDPAPASKSVEEPLAEYEALEVNTDQRFYKIAGNNTRRITPDVPNPLPQDYLNNLKKLGKAYCTGRNNGLSRDVLKDATLNMANSPKERLYHLMVFTIAGSAAVQTYCPQYIEDFNHEPI